MKIKMSSDVRDGKKLTHRGKFDHQFSGDCFRFASTQLD